MKPRIPDAPLPTALFACLALLTVPPSHSQPVSMRDASSQPAGVQADWWQQVAQSIQLDAYRPKRGTGSGPDVILAVNPAHRFQSRFDPSGVRLTPTGSTSEEWSWELELESWGRPGRLRPAPGGRLTTRNDRVEIERHSGGGLLTEWFVNRPEGLEHGFDVPVREAGEGDFVIDLKLRGDLRPRFAEDGQAVDFHDAASIAVLRYAKLVVVDAVGGRPPARMEHRPGGIRLVVEDRNAVYPITIDPLATSAAWSQNGTTNSDYGLAVMTAGDVNGDGYSDVVVGAPAISGAGAGNAYLYLGNASGLQSGPAWTAAGGGFDYFGAALASGDFNGDGYSDVAVGAPIEGNVYVYQGGPGGLSASADWTFFGSTYFGGTLTTGDVNGDGYSDLIVGTVFGGGGVLHVFHGGGSGLEALYSTEIPSIATEFGTSVVASDLNADGYADVVVGDPSWSGDTGRTYVFQGSALGLMSTVAGFTDGETTGDRFGSAMAAAGDIDGDGYADYLVGAPNHATDAGKVYLFPGSSNLAIQLWTWTEDGESPLDLFGSALATAGDVDGDGFPEVLIGAPGFGGGLGKVYLYPGSTSGLSSQAWSKAGTQPVGFGTAVAPAGDVNGDGYSDVVIGSSLLGALGSAELFLGGPNAPQATAIQSWNGEFASDYFGASVSSAGDVNGDGYSDVLVGAYNQNGSIGKSYLFPGGPAGPEATPDWTAVGEASGDSFGASVAGAGDVNGDGYSDVLIGAYGHNAGTGKAYVYLGSPIGLSATPSWTGLGEAVGDEFGRSVASAGDVNQDGYLDVVIGAHQHAGAGRAYVFLGSPAGLGTNPSWSTDGEAAGDEFGRSVASAGDVDGDGYSDVLVGAWLHGGVGKAYLYLGGPLGPAAGSSWSMLGQSSSNGFGYSLAGAGDVNGDGYSDVLVGAPNYLAVGKAYLYLGGPIGPAASPIWTDSGTLNNESFGRSVAAAGDVDNDGYSDIVVGASGTFSSTGRAEVYAGSATGVLGSPIWSGTGEGFGSSYGISVSGAGDVNGDGFADIVVGSSRLGSFAGKAYAHLGNNPGIPVLPRQLRSDLTAPIAPLAAAHEQALRLGLNLRSPMGRARARIEWQIAQLGQSFLPAQNPIQAEPTWWGAVGPGPSRTVSVTLPESPQPYTWRARIAYDPATSPFLHHGPWVTVSANGVRETDLLSLSTVVPPPCYAPDEPVWLYQVTLSVPDNHPILHFQDPNQPGDVTGYHVRRSDDPAPAKESWPLVATNVVDMDESTPNLQWTDSSGDVPPSGTWYYQVTAYNGGCGAEGPF